MDASGPASGDVPAVRAGAAWAWLSVPPEALLGECRQSRFQGSGPGGQKRNRVYSGVRVNHPASGLSAESVDSRASARNLDAAVARLRLALALAGAAAADADPAPGLPFRSAANPSHPDYARCALRALSLLRAHAGQLAPAAAALGCTPSALTRFLKEEKAVWARAREIRVGNGLHPLK